MDFNPDGENEEAGLILLNNGSHFDLMVQYKNGQRILVVKLQFGQTLYRSAEIELKPGYVDLRIEGNGPEFTFSYAQNNEAFKVVEKTDARFLSTQTLGWFTGVYTGLYATGNGAESKAPAVFYWFDYEGK
jgi:xylan 1,4-beta-xylosidase